MKQVGREFLKFAITSGIATGIHYGLYYLFLHWIGVNPAYTIGYIASIVCNYFMTARITFRTGESAGNAIGYVVCHLINYGVHMGLLNFFINVVGMGRLWAFVPTYAIAGTLNFFLLRLVFKKICK